MSPAIVFAVAQVPSVSTGYGWTTKPWGNTSAFYATRAKVEAEFAKKPAFEPFVARWRSLATKPNARIADRFGYGVAVVIVACDQGKKVGFEKDISRALKEVAAADVPANFETARVRYLLERSVWPSPKAWPVVGRLIARDPNDQTVLYFGSIDLAWGAPDLKTRLRGLSIAEDLAHQADRYPRRLRALAAANEGVWNVNKDPARLTAAILAWRRLIGTLRPNDPTRKSVESTIRYLESRKRTI